MGWRAGDHALQNTLPRMATLHWALPIGGVIVAPVTADEMNFFVRGIGQSEFPATFGGGRRAHPWRLPFLA